MKILKISALADGSRPPIQSWDGDTLPEGYAWVPKELDDGRFEVANGFVTVAVDGNDTVTAMMENTAAREAWLAGREGEEPEPVPTLEDRVAALETDAANDRAALTLLLTGEDTEVTT